MAGLLPNLNAALAWTGTCTVKSIFRPPWCHRRIYYYYY